MARDSTQRPRPSVPRGNAASPPDAHIGGVSMCSRSCSSGSCGATQGANTANDSITKRMLPPTHTRGWRPNWRHAPQVTPAQRAGGGRRGGGGGGETEVAQGGGGEGRGGGRGGGRGRRGGHCRRGHGVLSRGFNTAYRTSTITVIASISTQKIRAMPWINGRSLPLTACTIRFPMPGKPKIISTSNAPPNRKPNCTPIMVTVGS